MVEQLTYEGVTFAKDVVAAMTKEAFIQAHIDHFWLDRNKTTRRKMLGRVYDLITAKTDE